MYTYDSYNMEFQLDSNYSKRDILYRISIEMLGSIYKGDKMFLNIDMNILSFIKKSMGEESEDNKCIYEQFTKNCKIYIKRKNKNLVATAQCFSTSNSDETYEIIEIMSLNNNIIFIKDTINTLDFKNIKLAKHYGLKFDFELINEIKLEFKSSIPNIVKNDLLNIIFLTKNYNNICVEKMKEDDKKHVLGSIIRRAAHLNMYPIEYISLGTNKILDYIIDEELRKNKYIKKFKKAITNDTYKKDLLHNMSNLIRKNIDVYSHPNKINTFFNSGILGVNLLKENENIDCFTQIISDYNKIIHKIVVNISDKLNELNKHSEKHSIKINDLLQVKNMIYPYAVVDYNERYTKTGINFIVYEAKIFFYKDVEENTYDENPFGYTLSDTSEMEEISVLKLREDYKIEKLKITDNNGNIIYEMPEDIYNNLNVILEKASYISFLMNQEMYLT